MSQRVKRAKSEKEEENTTTAAINGSNHTLTFADIEKLLENDQKVQIGGSDIDGVLRGKIMKKSKFLSTIKDGFGFCGVIFGWDISDKVYDNVTVSCGETGFGDMIAKIDIQTMRRIPWRDNTPFFTVDFVSADYSPLHVCPRNLLKRVIEDLKQNGFQAFSSVEYEFYNFKETPQTIEEKGHKDLTSLTPGMFGYSVLRPSLNREYFDDIFQHCLKFNIPIEGLHTETGPGVYEAAIEYCDVLGAADRGQLFKTAVKEIGMKHQIMPTFMAKPFPNLPGCSGHTHYSLWDLEGKNNLFYDEKDELNMSDLMKHFIAGQLHCLPYILPMFLPTINSYKRLVEGAWAPVVLSWGVDNRTSSVRVIRAGPKNTRIETRVGGADMNCYLGMAASLASGLYGIKNKLTIPPQAKGDNLADHKLQKLSKNLGDAAKLMGAKDSVARELFGNEFVDHFVATRDWEWRTFEKAVTDWETKRYFELV